MRVPDAAPPPRLRTDVCPHCQAKRRVLNGARLRWTRERAGVDQRTFAAMIGISGPYLSDIERNRRECPPHVRDLYEQFARVKKG